MLFEYIKRDKTQTEHVFNIHLESWRCGMDESIFEVNGIGVSAAFQRRLKWAHIRKFSGLVHWRYPYWGGAIWRLTRDHRIRLRSMLKYVDLQKYNHGRLEDEGIMHQLARHAGITGNRLPGGDRWAHGSYQAKIENSAFIHVRNRFARKGPKVGKLAVYKSLLERGLIAE